MADTSSQRKPSICTSRFTNLCLLIAVFIAAPSQASAQPQDINLNTPATSEQIQTWLYSGDPRLIAWGAHFAREQNDQRALALIEQRLARWTPPQVASDKTTREQQAPTDAMLDALIQRDQTLPLDTLEAIAPFFPNQAAIFAKNLPIYEVAPLLLNWYSQRSADDRNRIALARIASIMLSHEPPPGFAASVLSESEETLRISVVSDESEGMGFGSGGSCGADMTLSPTGWPPVFTYALEENFQQPSRPKSVDTAQCQPASPAVQISVPPLPAPLLVEAAGDRINYFRYNLYGSPPFCGGLIKLNATNRHHLLAQMLGIADDEMPWKADTSTSIVWHGDDQFTHEASATVAAEEAKLHTAVEAIESKSLLTADEAAAVRPKLSVTIQDFRVPDSPPLPQLIFDDPRTTLTH